MKVIDLLRKTDVLEPIQRSYTVHIRVGDVVFLVKDVTIDHDTENVVIVADYVPYSPAR